MYEFFYYDSSSSFEEFISSSLNTLSTNHNLGISLSKPDDFQGVVNPYFDNNLYMKTSKNGIKGYEFLIENLSENKVFNPQNEESFYKFTVYEIPKTPESLKVKFGCELEVCFILNCSTLNSKQFNDLKQDIEELLEDKDLKETSSGLIWQKIIYYHIIHTIIPSLKQRNLLTRFTEKFKYIQLFREYHSNEHEDVEIIDLLTGKIAKLSNTKIGYKTLIFEPDISIKCDYTSSGNERSEVPQIPISCEIVTPILDDLDDLKLLYEGLFGDTRSSQTSCIQSNKSMGFHVNVSLERSSWRSSKSSRDSEKLTELSPGMLSELIYTWLPYETKKYKELRGEGSTYAKNIRNLFNDFEDFKSQYDNIKTLKSETFQKDDFYNPYDLGLKLLLEIFNSEKYLSMTNYKQNNVIEFRIFNSNSDIDKLVSYTSDAINVFKSAIEKFIKNPENTLIQIQKNNLKYQYINKSLEIPYFNEYSSLYFLYQLEKKYNYNLEILYIYKTKTSPILNALGASFLTSYQKNYFVKPIYKIYDDEILDKYKSFKIVLSFKITTSKSLEFTTKSNYRYFEYDLEYINGSPDNSEDTETKFKLSNPKEISKEYLENLKQQYKTNKL